MSRSLDTSPFVAALPPLTGGDLVGTAEGTAPDGRTFGIEIREIGPAGHRLCARRGNHCYVLTVPASAGFESISDQLIRQMPVPDRGNTHTFLTLVAVRHGGDGGESDLTVKVESGDGLGEGARPGSRPMADGRPDRGSYHRLAGYGTLPPLPRYASDLDFRALVYDDVWEVGRDVAKRAGGVRSLWLEDASDELATHRSLYKLIRRESAVPDALPDDLPTAGDDFIEARDCPVAGHGGPIERIDLSPSADSSFLYATEPDAAKRAEMRAGLLREAERRLAAHELSFGRERPTRDMTLREFMAGRLEYNLSASEVPPRYASAPNRSCGTAWVYGEERRGDGLVLWQEIYTDAHGNVASRFHVPTRAGTITVGSSDVAATLLYMEAQADRDPRVSRSPVSAFDYGALRGNGAYHGWDWTSFSFPDAPEFHLRIRTVNGGFRSEFQPDIVHPTLEDALRVSFDGITAAVREPDLASRP